jgi:hypothetical protein
MDSTQEHTNQRIVGETAALELETRGEIAMTLGKALLGMDLILVCFVDVGWRTGSLLFFWWVIAEGVLGLVLAGVGVHQKSQAQRKLNAVGPNNAPH